MILDQGTWLPVVWDTTLSDAEGQNYSVNIGQWQRLGNRILITGKIIMTSLGTLTTTDSCNIGGLPFVSSSTADSEGGIQCGYGATVSITAEDTIAGIINTNVSYIRLNNWDNKTSPTDLLLSKLSATGVLTFHGQYITDE